VQPIPVQYRKTTEHVKGSTVSAIPANSARLSILLVDDRSSVRDGLRMLLHTQPNFQIVGEAADGAEGVRLARTLEPDLVIMDVQMPELDGITATSEIVRTLPQCSVIILSIYDDEATRARATSAGADAFVAKYEAERMLIPAVEGVGWRLAA
jgi:DNA-binding NarL/FixJ family response regulator